jgi:hypothetical protein
MRQSVEIVVVCPNQEADALLSYLHGLTDPGGEVVVEGILVKATTAAFKSEKIVSFVLSFTVGVANGVVGNALYDALKSAPTAQCMVVRDPLSREVARDAQALDDKLHSAAKPREKPSTDR